MLLCWKWFFRSSSLGTLVSDFFSASLRSICSGWMVFSISLARPSKSYVHSRIFYMSCRRKINSSLSPCTWLVKLPMQFWHWCSALSTSDSEGSAGADNGGNICKPLNCLSAYCPALLLNISSASHTPWSKRLLASILVHWSSDPSLGACW